MSRSVFLIAASTLAVAACQPAEDAAETLEAETPPLVEESVDVEVASAAPEETSAEAETDHDHDDDEDDHDGHDDEAHDDHGDDHDDEHDHDDAGGEAHVHGLSELAASLDGTTLSISVEGALANFDLDETIRTLDDTTSYSDRLVEVIGGDCTWDSTDVGIRPIDDHGNLTVDLTYTCGAGDAIEAIEVTGFQTFAGFEQVNAVFLTESSQTAETLTESNTRLDIN